MTPAQTSARIIITLLRSHRTLELPDKLGFGFRFSPGWPDPPGAVSVPSPGGRLHNAVAHQKTPTTENVKRLPPDYSNNAPDTLAI